ncbi:MAG: hypothetical protein E3J56_01710 [Candidatus Aminicenantes bacterium]|nr:MAG: hypothetical protein E3J56_01710 [Candidatus Aminicenantes bacterium]
MKYFITIKSIRGAGGGYILSRHPSKTVHHVFEYLEQFGMSFYRQNLRRSQSDIGGFSLSELFLEGSPKGQSVLKKHL